MRITQTTCREQPQHSIGKSRARRGAHAVEFAVVGGVMFIFILGLVELGRGFMVQHLMTNAARQGCRIGIIPGKSNSDIINAVNTTLTAQGVRGDTATVLINDNTADASTAKSGDEITVTVTVPVSSITWVPGTGFLKGSIASQYTLRRE